MPKVTCHIPAFAHRDQLIIAYISKICEDNNITIDQRISESGIKIYVESASDRDKFKTVILKELNKIVSDIKRITDSDLNDKPTLMS